MRVTMMRMACGLLVGLTAVGVGVGQQAAAPAAAPVNPHAAVALWARVRPGVKARPLRRR